MGISKKDIVKEKIIKGVAYFINKGSKEIFIENLHSENPADYYDSLIAPNGKPVEYDPSRYDDGEKSLRTKDLSLKQLRHIANSDNSTRKKIKPRVKTKTDKITVKVHPLIFTFRIPSVGTKDYIVRKTFTKLKEKLNKITNLEWTITVNQKNIIRKKTIKPTLV